MTLFNLFILLYLDGEFYSDNSSGSDQPLNMAIKSGGQFLKKLRSLMKNPTFVPEPLQAYIIPSCDSHQSEYIASCDERRAFISGFTGSYGTAIVTTDDATLWTDGRYYLQAERQLDSNWRLMKQSSPGTLTPSEWLVKILPPNSRVGVDPFLMAYSSWKNFSSPLEEAGHSLIPVPENLIDLVWEERPPPPQNAINPLSDKYTGRSWVEKVNDVRSKLNEKKAVALVITALDEVAYLLNLRGSDIDFNPVFFSYVVVTLESVYLFVDENKLTPASRKHINIDSDGLPSVELRPYKMIKDFIKWLLTQEPGKIWISNNSSYALVSMIPEKRRILDTSPVSLAKAIKNPVEIECMKRSHVSLDTFTYSFYLFFHFYIYLYIILSSPFSYDAIKSCLLILLIYNLQVKDAVALCEFFSWLEEALNSSESVTEISAAEKLEEFRR